MRTVNGHFSNSRHFHIIGTESLHLLLRYGKKEMFTITIYLNHKINESKNIFHLRI